MLTDMTDKLTHEILDQISDLCDIAETRTGKPSVYDKHLAHTVRRWVVRQRDFIEIPPLNPMSIYSSREYDNHA